MLQYRGHVEEALGLALPNEFYDINYLSDAKSDLDECDTPRMPHEAEDAWRQRHEASKVAFYNRLAAEVGIHKREDETAKPGVWERIARVCRSETVSICGAPR